MALLAIVAHLATAAGAQTIAEHNTAGVKAYNEGKWVEAVEHLEQAYQLDTENAIVRRNLCNAYHAYAITLAEAARLGDAASQLELATSVDPENPLPYIQLGVCYLRMSKVDEAIFCLEDAIKLDAENLDAHDLLGQAYYSDNDIAAALAQWEYVQEIQPDRPGLQKRLGEAYRHEAVEFGFRNTESRHFRVSYGKGTSGGDLSKVLALCEQAYRHIGRKFGNVYPPSPIQVILYTDEDFKRATLLGKHVGALYDGKIRVPIKDQTGAAISESELRRRLFHEYTHVVVVFWVGNTVPWWLNEGLAETFSRDNGLVGRDVQLLQQQRRDGGLFHLSDLEDSQLTALDRDALWFAYVQSHATVRYMWNRFGLKRLATLLDALAEGVPPEEALQQSYRRTYELMEKEVAASIGEMRPGG